MFDDLQKVIAWLAAALSGTLLWVGKREVHRIDALEAKVNKLVTKEEFTQALTSWRDERRNMHEENRSTLSRIHERVDALWERGEK